MAKAASAIKPTSTHPRARYDNLDFLKFIAIFFVVCLHNFFLPINFLQTKTIESYVGYSLRLFFEGVPIFVAISGFLLLPRTTDVKKIFKKAGKILFLIFIWSISYYICLNLLYNQPFHLRDLILNSLRLGISNKYAGFLWYLQSLIGIYLLLPIISYIFNNNRKLYHYFTILVVCCSAGITTIMMIINPVATMLGMKELPAALQTFMSAYAPLHSVSFLSFFLVGGELYIFRDRLKAKKFQKYAWISLIASIIICAAYGIATATMSPALFKNNLVYSSIFMLVILAALYILTQNYTKSSWLSQLVCSIGKNSLGVYLLHTIIIRICSLLGITAFFAQASWGVGILFEDILILLIAYILTITLTRIPYVRKLITL